MAVPAGENVLCQFAAQLAMEGLLHRTIKSYMSGVRHLHIEEGFSSPFEPAQPKLHYVLRGIKQAKGAAGTCTKVSHPITPPLLRKIKARSWCGQHIA